MISGEAELDPVPRTPETKVHEIHGPGEKPCWCGHNAPAPEKLTHREAEVLAERIAGYTNTQVAAHLGIGQRTVEKFVERIIAKGHGRELPSRPGSPHHRTVDEGIAALAEVDKPVAGLVAALMLQSSQGIASTWQALYEGEKRARLRSDILLSLVRGRIAELLDGPYMPNPRDIAAALHPDYGYVDRLVEAAMEKDGTREAS